VSERDPDRLHEPDGWVHMVRVEGSDGSYEQDVEIMRRHVVGQTEDGADIVLVPVIDTETDERSVQEFTMRRVKFDGFFRLGPRPPEKSDGP
jgi:hypothetical protein